MILLTIFTRGYNRRYFLQREVQRVNNITRTEALTPNDTSILDKPERVPFVITYNPALRSISYTFTSLFHPPPPHPCCYNGPAPIVNYKRSSNLNDFLVRAETSQSHTTQPSLGLIPVRKKLSRLVNTYLKDVQTSVHIPRYRRDQAYH